MNTVTVTDDLKEVGVFLQNHRKQKNRTQAEMAGYMGTTSTSIARLEAGGGKKAHSPSLKTLSKYARGLGYDVVIGFVPRVMPK